MPDSMAFTAFQDALLGNAPSEDLLPLLTDCIQGTGPSGFSRALVSFEQACREEGQYWQLARSLKTDLDLYLIPSDASSREQAAARIRDGIACLGTEASLAFLFQELIPDGTSLGYTAESLSWFLGQLCLLHPLPPVVKLLACLSAGILDPERILLEYGTDTLSQFVSLMLGTA